MDATYRLERITYRLSPTVRSSFLVRELPRQYSSLRMTRLPYSTRP